MQLKPIKIALKVLFTASFSLASITHAIGADSVGTTSGSFFKMASVARPVAMGQAYVALADDIAAIHYNPAGLDNVRNLTLQASHTVWFKGSAAEHLSGAIPLPFGTLGLNLSYLSFPSQVSIEQTGNFSNPMLNYRETGSFSPGAMFAILGYGAPLSDTLQLGMGLKVISENPTGFSGPSATGVAVDLGVLGQTPVQGLAFGFSAQNLGFGSQVAGTNFGSAVLLRSGLSYRALADTLALVSELDFPNDTPIAAAVGLEYALEKIFYPRLGLRYDGIYNPWSAGLGIRVKSLRFDLAMVPMGELGQTYRASVEWSFGKSEKTSKLKQSQAQKKMVKPIVSAPAVVTAVVPESVANTAPPSTSPAQPQVTNTASQLLTPQKIIVDNLRSSPNPFWSAGTYIYFDLNTDADIELLVFLNQSLVRSQKVGHVNSGLKRWIYFNALDGRGHPLPKGEYEYQIVASKGPSKTVRQESFRRGPEPDKKR